MSLLSSFSTAAFSLFRGRIAIILTVISIVIVPLVITVLKGIGLGLVVYYGFDTILSSALLLLKNTILQQDPQIINLIALLKVDKAVTIFISTATIRLIYSGLKTTSGSPSTVTKMRF